MNLRKSFKNPVVSMNVGLVFLLVASAGRYFLRPGGRISADMLDGVLGLAYGIAIGAMLWSLVQRRRRSSPC
ncbi:MAG: hypothetical protein ABI960_01355 [Candidatus Eisenbacteria bacterium]